MESRLLIVAFVLAAIITFGQVPQTLSFQGRLVEGGVPVDGTRNIEFNLYDVASGGSSLWNEMHVGVTVTGGLFNVILGMSTDFETAGVTFEDQYWIGISVNGGPEISPRYFLTSSAYAMNIADRIIKTDEQIFETDLHLDGPIGGDRTIWFGDDHYCGVGENPSEDDDLLLTGDNVWVYAGQLKPDIGGADLGSPADPWDCIYMTGTFYVDGAAPGNMYLGTTAGGNLTYLSAPGGSDNDWAYASGSDLTGDIYHTGSVGIGTSLPEDLLEIRDDAAITRVVMRNDNASGEMWYSFSQSGDKYAGLIFENSDNHLRFYNNFPLGYFTFQNAGGTERMRIEWDGDVGIGTSSPDQKLHIYDATNTYLHLESDAFAFYIADGGGSSNSGLSLRNNGITEGLIWWDPLDDMLEFSSGNGSGAEMVIDTLGHVGIGSDPSAARLLVSGTGYEAFYGSKNTTSPAVEWRFGTYDDNSFSIVKLTGSTFTPLVIDTLGRVGIMESTPAALLQVGSGTDDDIQIGSQKITDIGVWEFEMQGTLIPQLSSDDLGSASDEWNNVYCVTLNESSDRRLKTSIEDLGYGLDEVMRLKPVSYERTDRPWMGKCIGLIAQDVNEVVNEAVHTQSYKVIDEETGEMDYVDNEYLSIDYTDLIPVLINAVKEQQAEIEELKSEIESLKNNQ